MFLGGVYGHVCVCVYVRVRTCIPASVHEYVCVEVHLCTGMWHEHHFSGVIYPDL